MHGSILNSFIAPKPLQEVEVVVGIVLEIIIPVHPAIVTVASPKLVKVFYLLGIFEPIFASLALHPW